MKQAYEIIGAFVFWATVAGMPLFYILANFYSIISYFKQRCAMLQFYYWFYILGKVYPTEKCRKVFKSHPFYRTKHLRKQVLMYRLRNIRRVVISNLV